MSLVENQESVKSVENRSSRSESEEPHVDQKADSSHKKESRERSHHRGHKDRHREDKDSSSKHRSSHHKSSRDDRHRDHRHKEADRHRDRHHKDEEGSRSSKSKRHHSSRERDSHRDRDKKHGKNRSRSVSFERSPHRNSSRDRKSSSRRHDSRDRKSHHRDKDRQKHESSSSRRDERKQDDRSKCTGISSSKVVEPPVLSTKAGEPAPSLLNPDGTPNAQEILKSIKIPDHLKFNQIEAQKYQMEQLRLKTEELTGIKVPSFYNTAAVNPLVYAEQQKKRKLLWSKAKDNGATTTSLIGKAIVEGQDEKTSEKFRKLMGLKSTEEPGGAGSGANDTIQMKQKFNSIAQAMDKEYEMARMTTHTHRGQGLGFATAGFFDPNQPRPT